MNEMLSNLKLSKYNHYLQKDNNLHALNAVTSAIVEFEDCNIESLMHKIDSLSNEEIKWLIDNFFLVDKQINEYKQFIERFNKLRNEHCGLSVTVGFTFRCNFNCVYCIQKENYNTRSSLNLEDIDSINNWIDQALESNKKINKISINYFGGEPTLNLDAVYYLTQKINDLAKEKHLSKYYQMVTNGYALNSESINLLLNYGIKDFQITVDGPKQIHNSRRSPNFDSFSKIIENILELISKNATIYLLHVYDESNLSSTYELIDFFETLSQNSPKLKRQLYFSFASTIPKNVESVKCNKYIVGKEVLLSNHGIEVYNYATQKGFRYSNFLDVNCCFRQVKNSLLISPDLNLYKCYSVFGMENFSFGNIKNTTFNDYLKKSESFSLLNGYFDKCENCNVVPICRGGCQFMASQNNGKYGSTYCEKEIIENYVNGFLKHGLYQRREKINESIT